MSILRKSQAAISLIFGEAKFAPLFGSLYPPINPSRPQTAGDTQTHQMDVLSDYRHESDAFFLLLATIQGIGDRTDRPP
jgi:hypothetical protein